MLRCLGIISCMIVLASGSLADDEITLKFKELAKGEPRRIVKEERGRLKAKLVDGDGKVFHEDDQKNETDYIYEEIILEVCEKTKFPSKVQRKYEKAVKKTGQQSTKLPFDGKTVILSRKNGKCSFEWPDGKKVSKEAAAELAKSFDPNPVDANIENKILFPRDTFRVGDSWTIDSLSLLKHNPDLKGLKADAKKAVGRVKVLRVFEMDGARCAECTLECSVPFVGGTLRELPIPEGSTLTVKMKMTLVCCIDGTSHYQKGDGVFEIEMKGKMDVGMGIAVEMLVEGTSENKYEESEPKKK